MAIPQWETPPCATDRIRQWETPPTAAYGLSFQKATFLRARLVGTSTVSEAPSPIHMGNTGKYNGKHRRVLLTEFANGKRHPQPRKAPYILPVTNTGVSYWLNLTVALAVASY